MSKKRQQPSTEAFIAEVTSKSNVTRMPAQSSGKAALRLDDGTVEKIEGPTKWAQVNLKVTEAEKRQIEQWASRQTPKMSMKKVFLEGYKLLREKNGG